MGCQEGGIALPGFPYTALISIIGLEKIDWSWTETVMEADAGEEEFFFLK